MARWEEGSRCATIDERDVIDGWRCVMSAGATRGWVFGGKIGLQICLLNYIGLCIVCVRITYCRSYGAHTFRRFLRIERRADLVANRMKTRLTMRCSCVCCDSDSEHARHEHTQPAHTKYHAHRIMHTEDVEILKPDYVLTGTNWMHLDVCLCVSVCVRVGGVCIHVETHRIRDG